MLFINFARIFLIFQMINRSKQNYSKSQFSLAKIYYLGKHVIENIKRALHYFQLGANHNNSYARYIMSIFYLEVKHITRDINNAIHYLSPAAEKISKKK